jgi:hypothetical protein
VQLGTATTSFVGAGTALGKLLISDNGGSNEGLGELLVVESLAGGRTDFGSDGAVAGGIGGSMGVVGVCATSVPANPPANPTVNPREVNQHFNDVCITRPHTEPTDRHRYELSFVAYLRNCRESARLPVIV